MRYKTELTKLYIRRRSTKFARDIVSRYPDIGKVIEEHARACDVGADQWRRTGLLTFGAQKKTEKRLTFENLRVYLEGYYNRPFSIETMVELCTKRNGTGLVRDAEKWQK